MTNIHIKGGRLVDPKSGLDARQDLFIADGRIAALGKPPAGFRAARTLEASNHVVCPGLIDLSARLREPGFEYKATLESEMQAAIAGGVTSLVCPPDTDPPLDEPGLVEMLKYRARNLNLAHVYPLGALTWKLEGERLTEMVVLRDAGCVAFSHADTPLPDTQVLWRALQYAGTFGIPVWLRPQDGYLARGGVAHDGDVATRLGLPGIPSVSETIALSTILQLVRETRTRVHLCRLSTAESVAMVHAAKSEGLPVTCDVSAHHAHLCETDLGYFDAHCHVIPPFRTLRDRDALRSGLADGTIDAICSDHAPVDEDAKQLPFAESEPGATVRPAVRLHRRRGGERHQRGLRIPQGPRQGAGCDEAPRPAGWRPPRLRSGRGRRPRGRREPATEGGRGAAADAGGARCRVRGSSWRQR